MRTLLVGLSLPHVSFDNATFLSAPSFSEYQRVVVDLATAGQAVQDVVDGTKPATTFAGQAVVNGAASAYAFPLAELLEMRKRETSRLLDAGGVIVLVGHPLAVINGLDGLTGWTNLSWLPDPTESDWTALLKPGFGREGAVLTDSEHAFAPFVAQLVQRFGYRVAADEDALAACKGGHVFARSSGGAAIGFELALGGGRVIVVPAINKPERDREQIAAALLDSFERMAGVATNDKVNESTGVN